MAPFIKNLAKVTAVISSSRVIRYTMLTCVDSFKGESGPYSPCPAAMIGDVDKLNMILSNR
jgi:hypothetical protein